jgi:hypothetical protein
LVAIRPKSTQKDLPSTYNVTKYLYNQFIDRLEGLKGDITVSEDQIIRNKAHNGA